MSAFRMKPPMHGRGIRAGHPLATGLELHVPFWEDKSSPFANGVTQNHRIGTLTGGAAWAKGPRGGVMNFDGVDAWVSIPFSHIDEVTFSAWVKADSLAGNRPLVFFDNYSASDEWYVWIASIGETQFVTYASDRKSLDVAHGFAAGEWHHWAFTYRSGDKQIWRDGVSIASTAASTGSLANRGAAILRIGLWSTSEFLGQVDNITVHSRALIAPEVLELAEQPYTLITPRQRTYIYGVGAPPVGNRRRRLLLAG